MARSLLAHTADAIIQSWVNELTNVSPPSDERGSGGSLSFQFLPSPPHVHLPHSTFPTNSGDLPIVRAGNLTQELVIEGGGGDEDYVSTMDWGEGPVRENVRKVMMGLLQTPVNESEGKKRRRRERVVDPSVTMEMRHQQVSKRETVNP